ncbi:hypothetical protein WA016_05276 [Myxococcus stipitatus]
MFPCLLPRAGRWTPSRDSGSPRTPRAWKSRVLVSMRRGWPLPGRQRRALPGTVWMEGLIRKTVSSASPRGSARFRCHPRQGRAPQGRRLTRRDSTGGRCLLRSSLLRGLGRVRCLCRGWRRRSGPRLLGLPRLEEWGARDCRRPPRSSRAGGWSLEGEGACRLRVGPRGRWLMTRSWISSTPRCLAPRPPRSMICRCPCRGRESRRAVPRRCPLRGLPCPPARKTTRSRPSTSTT